jgi:hypothetical protein
VKPAGFARRAEPAGATDAGTVKRLAPAGGSALFPPFQRAPEMEGFGSGVDNVGTIRDPVQQSFADPRIRKHGCPFGKW